MRRLALGLAALCLAGPGAIAEPRHGLSAFGELKYPAGFAHFDYVDPDAPKGGRLALVGPSARSTFDSFNGYIVRGDAAQGLSLLLEDFSLIFDSLMTRSFDEPDAVYGLVAETADVAGDGKSVTFKLRREVRFADGSPLTAEDVVFSFDILKAKGHPNAQSMLRDVARAEALDPLTVRYTFSGDQVRDLPLAVAQLPIFSKAFYATRAFDQTTLEPPLGSGPYRIGDFKQGSFVSYRRRDDYWARDLPVRRGMHNFDEVRYVYYRDRGIALEAFKAGAFDYREEFTSKDWATSYDIPQVKDGRIVLLTLPDERPSGAQGFFLNMRRAKFKDPRVRRALDLAFDFEWTNKSLFYGLYTRTTSFFENSDMKAAGLPSAAELALLEPYRAQLPAEVFGEPYLPPVTDGTGNDRRPLAEAGRLLADAGYAVKSGKRTDPAGAPLEIEFLIVDPVSDRILQPYVKNLQALGIAASIRRVDAAQYERRLKSFDFDVVTARFVMGLTPGPGMRAFLSGVAARQDGSNNLAGIDSPAVDGLIEAAVRATSRGELTTTMRALDRVLRAGHYWVPQWYKTSHTIAHWNRFGRPARKPKYADGTVQTWWYDAAKADKINAH